MADDERQRILVFGANVDEMDVHPIDPGDEVWQGVQSRLALAPVVVVEPIAGELLHRLEAYTMRVICDWLLLGPAGSAEACTQILEIRFGCFDRERPDCRDGWCLCGCYCHE